MEVLVVPERGGGVGVNDTVRKVQAIISLNECRLRYTLCTKSVTVHKNEIDIQYYFLSAAIT